MSSTSDMKDELRGAPSSQPFQVAAEVSARAFRRGLHPCRRIPVEAELDSPVAARRLGLLCRPLLSLESSVVVVSGSSSPGQRRRARRPQGRRACIA